MVVGESNFLLFNDDANSIAQLIFVRQAAAWNGRLRILKNRKTERPGKMYIKG
jgi:hypothetical protein